MLCIRDANKSTDLKHFKLYSVQQVCSLLPLGKSMLDPHSQLLEGFLDCWHSAISLETLLSYKHTMQDEHSSVRYKSVECKSKVKETLQNW